MMAFLVNALTGEELTDEDEARLQSMQYRLSTALGDYEMKPGYGTRLLDFVDRRNTPENRAEIETIVREALRGIEDVTDFEISTSSDGVSVRVNGAYRLVLGE